MSWHQWVGFVSHIASAALTLYMIRTISQLSASRTELHEKYMLAQRQLAEAAESRYELSQEVATLLHKIREHEGGT